jgi:hypothetical protein
LKKILELQLDLAVIDEKKKKPMYYFLKPKRKKKNTNKLTKLQAELTTLKSKRLDGTF